MYTRVLIPLDGSEAAEAAVKEAIRMAPAIRSVHLLVVDEPVRGLVRLDGYVMYVDQWLRVRRELAEEYLRPIVEKLKRAGLLEVSFTVQFGDAMSSIVKTVKSLKPGLILLGGEEGGWFRRRRGLAGLAPRLSRRVSAAVLAVQEGAAEEAPAEEVPAAQAA